VDLADGARRQRPAAPAASGVKVGVEAVEDVDGHLAERQVTEDGEDRAPDVALVGEPRGQLEVGHLKPAVEQVGDGRPGVGAALLVDLAEQAGQELLGVLAGLGRAAEVALTPGDRVRPA